MNPPLVEIELVRVRLPLRRALRSAHGAEDVRDVVLVRVVDASGETGWGECSALAEPTYTSEYTAGAWSVLLDHLAPAALAGREAGVVGHPMAKAALATARLDASLRGSGRSLAGHLAAQVGRPREQVATCAVIGRAAAIDDSLSQVAAAREAGVALVKLKVTPHPHDLDTVAAVRRTWPDLGVAVDGNGSLDARSLSILDELGLAYIEQPAPADDLVASAGHAGRLATPVALDESIGTPGALDVATALGAGTILNLKPARVGGPALAVELAVRAAEQGWSCFCGGMLETGVGRAAALAVAALPLLGLPTDLGPTSRYVDVDLTPSIELDDGGRLTVPDGPGIGVRPDLEVLDRVAVDRVVLRP